MSVASQYESTPAEGRDRRRRRFRSKEEKRRIVAETLEPGASVSMVARRHDVNANQVFTWRRQFRDDVAGAEPCAFVPVVVPPEASPGMPGPGGAAEAPSDRVPAAPATITGRIEIVLAGGRRIVVDKTVNAAALARVIDVLERRPVCRSPGEGR